MWATQGVLSSSPLIAGGLLFFFDIVVFEKLGDFGRKALYVKAKMNWKHTKKGRKYFGIDHFERQMVRRVWTPVKCDWTACACILLPNLTLSGGSGKLKIAIDLWFQIRITIWSDVRVCQNNNRKLM